MAGTMAEKRVIKRHRKRLQVKFGIGTPTRLGFTEDFSNGGVFIKTTFIHPPQTVLRVELQTPMGEIVEAEAMVRWAKRVPPALLRTVKGGMGVRFLRFNAGEEAYRLLCQSHNDG
jgi:hypothetical protein